MKVSNKRKTIKDFRKENKILTKKYQESQKKNSILEIVVLIMIILFLIVGCNDIKRNINKKKVTKIKGLIAEREENYHNSEGKLDLTSAYGDNHPTHPKVLAFKKKWHGYKYWMTYSPYPHSDDSRENPHIKVSNDLVHWEDPKGFKNPLDDTPEDYEKEVIYLSDPHLVYNKDLNQLECYYRKVDKKNDEMILYRRTTKNGVKWNEREVVLTTKISEKDYVSPAIIYDEGMYKIWYVDKSNTVCYAESEDGYEYSDCKKIKLKYPAPVKTWHLDVIKTDYGYEMITVALHSWTDRGNMNIYYFKGKSETKFKKGSIILRPTLTSWDNRGMYRSSFIYENGIYYLFYSGISMDWDRGIGISYGENINDLKGATKEELKKGFKKE